MSAGTVPKNHGMKILDLPCKNITVGDRNRKDMGDLEGLADSIGTAGLLQPIGVTKDYRLVFGERRLRAMRDVLRWKTVPARIVDVQSIVVGEYTENEIRKDFTASERVAIAKAVEGEIGNRRGQRTDLSLPQNIAEVKGTETRDLASQKAGFGNRETYNQARRVVERGVEAVLAQMDRKELSISAAALIAEQTPARQREIATMPKQEKKEAVRMLRRKDLPTPAEAHRRAKATNMAILDRNMEFQTPEPMSERRPKIERTHAMIAVIEATEDIVRCKFPPAEVGAFIRSFDSRDKDCIGKCRKATAFLVEVTKELNREGSNELDRLTKGAGRHGAK